MFLKHWFIIDMTYDEKSYIILKGLLNISVKKLNVFYTCNVYCIQKKILLKTSESIVSMYCCCSWTTLYICFLEISQKPMSCQICPLNAYSLVFLTKMFPIKNNAIHQYCPLELPLLNNELSIH